MKGNKYSIKDVYFLTYSISIGLIWYIVLLPMSYRLGAIGALILLPIYLVSYEILFKNGVRIRDRVYKASDSYSIIETFVLLIFSIIVNTITFIIMFSIIYVECSELVWLIFLVFIVIYINQIRLGVIYKRKYTEEDDVIISNYYLRLILSIYITAIPIIFYLTNYLDKFK